METLAEQLKRVRAMSDEMLLSVWNAIWELPRWDRPDDDWCDIVYGELSNRGISAL